jgi:tetratricopeptide (TPR) repeat protein
MASKTPVNKYFPIFAQTSIDIVMASKTPTINDEAWIALLPQFLFWGFLAFIYSKFKLGLGYALACGTLTFLLISFTLQKLFCGNFMKGMKRIRQEQYSEAIPFFEDSVDFFTKNQWLDKYRFITLLSSSKRTYKEMALCNIAFCYSQSGNPLKAKEYYKRTLDEFPDNTIASAALRFIHSIEQSQ